MNFVFMLGPTAACMVLPFVAWLMCIFAIEPCLARAQAEVAVGVPVAVPASVPAPVADSDSEQVIIFDDEPGGPTSSPSPARAAEPWHSRASFKGELGALGMVDTSDDGEGEDDYETRLRLALESTYEYSERIHFMLGGRLNYFWASPANDPGAHEGSVRDAYRFELDAELMAASVALQVGSSVHVLAGQQVVATGRLDMFTSLDPLGVYDARAGPSLDLNSMRLPQPALRFDYDSGDLISLQLIFVPWFRPHRLRLGRDQHFTRVLLGDKAASVLAGGDSDENPSSGPIARELALELQGPPPSLAFPQAYGRIGFRLSMLDFGFSAAAALEKAPLVTPTAQLEAYLLNPSTQTSDPLVEVASANRPIASVQYPRYFLAGFDIGGSFGASSLAFEFALSPSRQLYTAPLGTGGAIRPNLDGPISDPNSRPRGVPTLQAGAHFDYSLGESFVMMVESTYFRALTLPNDLARYWVGLDPVRADFALLLVGGRWALADGTWTLGLSFVATTDPSLFTQPQVEYRPTEGVIIALGGLWAVGPEPAVQPAGGTASLALGGLSMRDNKMFLSARWLW